MNEPDSLSRKIRDLKDWQTAAWRRIADPLLTTIERREIRYHLRDSEFELRHYLDLMSEQLSFRPAAAEKVGDSHAKLQFRLLA